MAHRFVLSIGCICLLSGIAFGQDASTQRVIEARTTAQFAQIERFVGNYQISGTVGGQSIDGKLSIKRNRAGDAYEWVLSSRGVKNWPAKGVLSYDSANKAFSGTFTKEGTELKGGLSIESRTMTVKLNEGKEITGYTIRLIPPGGIEFKTTGDSAFIVTGKQQD